MSHRTEYKTFSNTDISALETQVNEYLKGLRKNEHHESIKVENITTIVSDKTYTAAITYSYVKKKKPEVNPDSNAAVAEVQP
jgi:hypothetical protein